MENRDLTKGSIYKSLLIVAIPSMLSMLLQFSYNIIDMYFLGIYDSTGGILSSIGTASLFITFAYGLNFLTTTGSGIKVSHQIGEDDDDDFYRYTNTGMILTGILGIFCFFIFFFFGRNLMEFSELTDEKILSDGTLYLRIYGFTIIFYFFNTVFTRIMVSMGNSTRSLLITGIGVFVNIILDYILILVLDLGILGASIASLLGNMVVTTIYFIDQRSILSKERKHGFSFEYAKTIILLGVPYTIQRFVFSIVGLFSGKTLISFGSDVIASQKLGLQIESVTLMVLSGLLSAMSAFAGQNYGARQYDRIKKGFRIAIAIGLIYSLFTSLVFLIFGGQIIHIFVDNPHIIQYGKYYLIFIAIGQPFAVLEMLGNGLYNGIGKPIIPSTISIVITPFRLVISGIFKGVMGAIAVFLGILITTAVKGSLSYGIYIFKIRGTLNENAQKKYDL